MTEPTRPVWLDCLIIFGVVIGVLMLLAVFVVGGTTERTGFCASTASLPP